MQAKTKKIIKVTTAMTLLVGITITASSVMYNYKEYMDTFLGSGEMHVSKPDSSVTGDYIDYKCNSKEEALANAQDVSLRTAEEGIVLLRNDNNTLPLQSKKVTLLGYYSWHNNMAGGEDPASEANAYSFGEGLDHEGFDVNPTVTSLYSNAGGDFADPATSLSTAAATFSQYKTAIVTFKRNSGEGQDQETDLGSAESNRTGLSLKNAELKLLDYACKNFESVIVVVNSANTMELGFLDPNDENYNGGTYKDPYSGQSYNFSKIKAALWAGCCGSQGGIALAKILDGEINPSGHTPDVYARYLRNDPSYQNFGNYEYKNAGGLNSYATSTFFVEYEEGIYIGYKYHETAAYEASRGKYTGYNYDTEVVYPFGYGLSYTNFAMKYAEDPTFNKDTNEYTFKVTVTNTGTVAGKGTAQIYVSAPWEEGQVEKSHVQLVGFEKTGILQPNASETLTVVVNQDYFTNFDYQGEKCYTLDKGNYKFYLSENSHSWANIADTDNDHLWSHEIKSKIVYKDGKDGKRPTDTSTAVNKMDEELNYKFKNYGDGETGDGYAHNFSRADFKKTFPTAPKKNDYYVAEDDETSRRLIAKYDVWAEDNQYIKDVVLTDTSSTTYTLADMRGVDFDDPKWDEYINQFSTESMVNMHVNGGWNELADTENGVPKSYDTDGPYGFFGRQVSLSNVNVWYCGGPMVAATFNTKLAKEIGEAFGEEAFQQKQNDGQAITGLYGFGCNTHRSAFGGRNYEYYSEDGILAGKMAAAEASGASEKGLIVFMKHYALNEQELNRQKNGYCSWVNEQAFREIYVKPWEIYMKEAKMDVKYYDTDDNGNFVMKTKTMSAATGIMTAYNRIGACYAGASESINEILRDEFNFTGTVLTDAGGEPNTYMTSDFALRRGNNLTLTNNGSNGLYDTSSDTAKYWLKQSTKHLLYNKANSNCLMNSVTGNLTPGAKITYDLSPWQSALIATWVVEGVLACGVAALDVCWAKGILKVKEKELTEEDLATKDYDY